MILVDTSVFIDYFKGVTVRSSIDLLVAQTAIHHRLFLLHNDRDFDRIAENLDALDIFDGRFL